MSESVERRIERGLILWLREKHGIKATKAHLSDPEFEAAYGGCDTCGYGETEEKISFDIVYFKPDERWSQSIEVSGTSLTFLPELLPYIERAN